MFERKALQLDCMILRLMINTTSPDEEVVIWSFENLNVVP
ncbi:hypothetical protein DJ46_1951 [Bacillus anthracis str. Vollum]|jgi:hypothetical protein|uniref:Uncharacterized protein n=2 Tax=Bacillus cereus group TaxID=86661 RepID=A0A640ML33_BACAN|nr:hypothetical protein YBT020_15850 [Bacillus thuringiensis serovar finitimus YBT-020]AIK33276.1 hypothetical protein DJ48_1126 [Bacillus anthracis]AIK62303.1 hypothetical protein DJ46_1951 [Bacillus anthracis str. Vollum]AJG45804.1 hypothetical protein AS53_5118 [Bacillus anthracis str. Turkey32]AJG55133.1 hypothetical protein AS54_3227 [Bacillus cereus 03BB102]AJG60244.1 hypothetical protein AW22_1472 [Bacillus cereus D17]AJH48434.1 hypothetical protein AW20_5256 [Bacillus anthracis str. S